MHDRVQIENGRWIIHRRATLVLVWLINEPLTFREVNDDVTGNLFKRQTLRLLEVVFVD